MQMRSNRTRQKQNQKKKKSPIPPESDPGPSRIQSTKRKVRMPSRFKTSVQMVTNLILRVKSATREILKAVVKVTSFGLTAMFAVTGIMFSAFTGRITQTVGSSVKTVQVDLLTKL